MEPSPNGALSDRDAAFKQLRTLVHAIAVSLLILTGTIFIFFYRQVVGVRKNTTELVNYIVEYQSSGAEDFITAMHRQLADFSKEHTDFTPIYRRYFGTNPPPAAAAAPERAKVAPAAER